MPREKLEVTDEMRELRRAYRLHGYKGLYNIIRKMKIYRGFTFFEIAYIFSLTPERVRQIEERAISKLKRPTVYNKRIRKYLEYSSHPLVIQNLNSIMKGGGKLCC